MTSSKSVMQNLDFVMQAAYGVMKHAEPTLRSRTGAPSGPWTPRNRHGTDRNHQSDRKPLGAA